MIDAPTVVAAVVPSVLALVWIVRIEGRVNTNDVEIRGLRLDVTYIRKRIDEAINGNGYAHRRKDDEE